jgi:hypothetical protein
MGAEMPATNVRSINAETGEILEGVAVWVGRKIQSPYGNRWYMQSQEALLEIITDKEVATGRTLRVLMYLLTRLDFENYIHVEQKEVGEQLRLQSSNVSKAISLLVDKGIVLRGPKVGRSYGWRLNPNFGWKGKVRNISSARRSSTPKATP